MTAIERGAGIRRIRFLSLFAAGLWLVAALQISVPDASAVVPAEAIQQFEAGNRHYAAGAYDAALQAYGAALASGYGSPALYYNLGNTYFRVDRLGQAIRFYEKAHRLAPRDARIRHNLQIARSRVAGDTAMLPEPYWRRWWFSVAAVDPRVFFGAGFLFYVLAAGLLLARLITGRRSAWRRRVVAGSAALAIPLLILAFAVSHAQTHSRRAILVTPQAVVRERPAFGAPVQATVREGLPLRVLDRSGTWLHVRLPDGTTGWLQARDAAGV